MAEPMIEMNDLARSWIATSAEVHSAVARVLRSGRSPLAAETQAFEAELAEFFGVEHALGISSGTDTLALAVGAGPGQEVIPGANAGGYGSIAASQNGARVVCADDDRATFAVVLDDRRDREQFDRDDRGVGVYVPPMILAGQCRSTADGVLAVVASHSEDAHDYIRDDATHLRERGVNP